MLWITGGILLLIWVVAKFVLGKSGAIHILLMMGLSLFVIQLVQDRRTKEYFRDQRSEGNKP